MFFTFLRFHIFFVFTFFQFFFLQFLTHSKTFLLLKIFSISTQKVDFWVRLVLHKKELRRFLVTEFFFSVKTGGPGGGAPLQRIFFSTFQKIDFLGRNRKKFTYKKVFKFDFKQKKRACLTEANFENLVFLKGNLHLFKQSLKLQEGE